MPFRFRKIFRLGKGFRLNLSKGGISTSIGKAGGTLNIGKGGIRPTVGIPGSGLSFTPSKNTVGTSAKGGNILTNSIAFVISLLLICVVCVCIVGLIFFPTTEETTTNTPTAVKLINPAIIIANTSSAAQTQTMLAAPSTSTATYMPPVTLAPTWTIVATPTIFIFALQTDVAQPTQYIYSTDTPFILATQALPPANGEVCSCKGPDLDCKLSDFPSHAAAQACYEYCVAKGYGDIYKIDGNDHDGLACENLP